MRKPAPVITRFFSLHIYVAFLCFAVLSISGNVVAADSSTPATQAIMLAQKGRCREALPILKKSILQITDKQVRYQTAMLTARCAMSLDQTESAVRALLLLPLHDAVIVATRWNVLLCAARAVSSRRKGASSGRRFE